MTMIDQNEPVSDLSGTAERDYLLRRAEEHRQLAENAKEMGTRQTHLRLCRLYRARAERDDVVFRD